MCVVKCDYPFVWAFIVFKRSCFCLILSKLSKASPLIQQNIEDIWRFIGLIFYAVLGMQLPISFILKSSFSFIVLILLTLLFRFAITHYLAHKHFDSSVTNKALISATFLPKLTLQLLFMSQIIPLDLPNKCSILSIISLSVLISCFTGLVLQGMFFKHFTNIKVWNLFLW